MVVLESSNSTSIDEGRRNTNSSTTSTTMFEMSGDTKQFSQKEEEAKRRQLAESESSEDEEFEVDFDGPEDPYCPKNLSKARKWAITIILSLGSLCCTCTSSIYTSTYAQLIEEFNHSELLVISGLSLFVFGLGIGPMILAPLSEFYGRRPIYVVSFTFFLLFLIPSAVAKNIETMLVARFLDGFAGSAFLSVAGGTVGDMFNKAELSLPMMIFTCAPFVGPTLGPLVGGFINQNTNWRWTFYVMLIWAAIMLSLIVLFVCETYPPVLLRKKARHLSKTSGKPYYAPIDKLTRSITHTVALSCLRPFQLLFLEPMVACLCLLTALLLGILYLFFQAFPRVFGGIYGFSLQETGIAFLGIFVGLLFGAGSDTIWKNQYNRLSTARTAKGLPPKPEYRLPSAIVGGILVPIGLLLFAFTQRKEIHWIVPILGSGIFAVGYVIVYAGVFTFLVEAYPLYAASALAANSFSRSSFAAAFPLFSEQLYDKLGNMWASALLAFLTIAMAPFPYIFFKYGEKLRGRSRFANAKLETGSKSSSRAVVAGDLEKQDEAGARV